jgi:hypothetical protein
MISTGSLGPDLETPCPGPGPLLHDPGPAALEILDHLVDVAQDDEALDLVLELPDIARPWIGHEHG